MKEKESLIKFYSECKAKGYNNMSDFNQRIKAKVIASDLGLDYENINSLYEQAKKEYEIDNLSGECLFDIYSNNTLYKVFKCSNGEIYCESNNTKYDNVNFIVKPRNIISYNYHPSKIFYTGASSGGVAMGGFHTTQDYNTVKLHETENGYITMSANGLSDVELTKITIDANIYQFIKVELYILGFKQTILCKKQINAQEQGIQSQILMNSFSSGGSVSLSSTASVINNENSLSIKECETISNLLIDIISNGDIKKTENDYLCEVENLIEKNDINSLSRAKAIVEYFNTPEFNKHLEKLTQKLDNAIQKVKEQKIIEEEQAAEEKGALFFKNLITGFIISFVIVIIITVLLISNGEVFFGIVVGIIGIIASIIGSFKYALDS